MFVKSHNGKVVLMYSDEAGGDEREVCLATAMAREKRSSYRGEMNSSERVGLLWNDTKCSRHSKSEIFGRRTVKSIEIGKTSYVPTSETNPPRDLIERAMCRSSGATRRGRAETYHGQFCTTKPQKHDTTVRPHGP